MLKEGAAIAHKKRDCQEKVCYEKKIVRTSSVSEGKKRKNRGKPYRGLPRRTFGGNLGGKENSYKPGLSGKGGFERDLQLPGGKKAAWLKLTS